jgi:signal transduction histidine kinase
MNVLLNAMQAMPNGGRLIVRAEATGSAPRQARIAISDTGPGILPEHRERIFEPYFTTKEGGTGLGLALAQKIIAEHHGDIQVEDHAGGGATFVIRLPLLPPGT